MLAAALVMMVAAVMVMMLVLMASVSAAFVRLRFLTVANFRLGFGFVFVIVKWSKSSIIFPVCAVYMRMGKLLMIDFVLVLVDAPFYYSLFSFTANVCVFVLILCFISPYLSICLSSCSPVASFFVHSMKHTLFSPVKLCRCQFGDLFVCFVIVGGDAVAISL